MAQNKGRLMPHPNMHTASSKTSYASRDNLVWFLGAVRC